MAERTLLAWQAGGVSALPSSNPSQRGYDATTRLPIWNFDAATDWTLYLEGTLPKGITLTSPFKLRCWGWMASATSGNVIDKAAVEAVTPGDSLDRDASTSFDSENLSTATAVPGTAGYEFTVDITLTNNDSMAAGDDIRIQVGRDADNASDTATGNQKISKWELLDDGG